MKAQIRACSEDPTIGLSRRWDTRFGWGLTIHRTRRNACLPIPLRWWPGYRNRTCPRSSLRPSSTASTLRPDQQDRQKGLFDDHSGGSTLWAPSQPVPSAQVTNAAPAGLLGDQQGGPPPSGWGLTPVKNPQGRHARLKSKWENTQKVQSSVLRTRA